MSKRRGNNEGSITRRKDGRWMGRYTVEGKQRTLYGKTREEVREKLAKAIADRDAGMVFDAGTITIGKYLEGWLTDSVAGTVRASTYDSYRRNVENQLIPYLGRVKLAKISPAHIRKAYREMTDNGLSPRTVQYAHSLLKKALKEAVMDNMIPRNPADAVKPPQVEREEISPLSADAVHTLLEAAEGERLGALYTVAVHTGMRQGELLGLKWDDVDLEAGTVAVRRVLDVKGNFTPPKTARSRRRVELSGAATAALKAHRHRQLEERMERAGLWEGHGLVFASEVGTPLSRHNLTRSFKRLLYRAGLPHSVRFHDLRHTCATLLLSRNVHPKYVQEMLGHANVSITLDTYSHVIPGMDGGTGSAMDEALG